MKRPLLVGTATFVAFLLGSTLAVLVAGSASAASPTTIATTTTASPGDGFLVLNGTVNAASDHEIVASSAFPNYTTGAVDNYYSLAHSHVDNSPFAQATASPFDTGPIGQTAAAGNTQQPQYADARWPGDGKAEYGNEGGPHAVASAGEYDATADASVASNALNGPSASHAIVLPKGLDGRIRMALAAWKATWLSRLAPKKPAPAVPAAPKPTVPKPPAVTTPVVTVTTPVGSVDVPPVPAPVQAPPPPAVPTPTVPTPSASAPSRSLASDSTPADGESLLSSSTKATLVAGPPKPKPAPAPTTTTTTTTKPAVPDKSYTLVTSGESSLGRVSLGGGQIVIRNIHVTASIANDGTPTYKAAVSVGSATIGGVPVTIDEDGVHVAGQTQALPYKQASDALNNALKQAGIQLYLVGPEVTTCGPAATSTTTTTTTTTDQSGAAAPVGACGQSAGTCDQTGTGTTATTTSPTDVTTTPATTTPGACGQTTCDQLGSSGGTGTTTTTTTTTATRPATTTSSAPGTTPTPASCNSAGMTPGADMCSPIGPAPGTTAGDPGSTAPLGSTDPMTFDFGASNAGEETVTATGVHVVFTQPVNQAGVPSQQIEHILGEVFVDSLATPAPDATSSLDLSGAASAGSTGACPGARHARSGKTASGGGLAAGGSSPSGGSAASSSLSPSASGFATGSQPLSGSGTTGSSLPVAFATALRKPLWLLLAYLVWQALVIGTGVSLWNWRKDDVS